MKTLIAHLKIIISSIVIILSGCQSRSSLQDYDLIIYGGTSAGISAAIQASRMGKRVLLLEPSSRIGGLTTGGLGQTDIGNKIAIGGISREFYQQVRVYYENPENWKWQKRSEYKDGGQTQTEGHEDAMWTFEPSAALKIYHSMLEKENVQLKYQQRLDRTNGIKKDGSRIISISMVSGETYEGKMFIDATYEGDLMAAAGVSYTLGREPNSMYGENLNGVQPSDTSRTITGSFSRNGINHNFVHGVDPYVIGGDSSSGLLPGINPAKLAKEGTGDDKIQAYCFRMCLTDHPDNRLPFQKPTGYNELDYELLLRNFEAGEKGFPWINSDMPNRKTDTNNRTGFSTDYIGQNYNYPEASYEERKKIVDAHRHYQQGLMWTLANHPRVPESIRTEVARWGTCKDEFIESPESPGNGWQSQLYIREARRMVSDLVMTQKHCEGIETVEDPIGLAAYGMDSHNIQRYVTKEGFVRNEGNVEAHVPSPYPVGYRSIIPRQNECSNLLVPVCLSASHIAFGSIRMEPVFMVLGQSAATAACLAIDQEASLQELDYSLLKNQLIKDKQRLVPGKM